MVKENICFKDPSRCYDLTFTNWTYAFQKTGALTTRFPIYHKTTVTFLKTEYFQADPIQVNYRYYKHYIRVIFPEESRDNLIENTPSNNIITIVKLFYKM